MRPGSRTRPTPILLATALALSGCRASPPPPPEPPPNVLVVVVDALRADRLGVAGYPHPTTPAIDALARAGVWFATAYANATWTKPSMATLFTSLYPSAHGATASALVQGDSLDAAVLDERATTMAEAFAAGGYRTGAFLVQPHLRERFGFAQGFETFKALRGKSARRQNEAFRTWRRQEDPRPFFAWVHYIDVHWPYDRSLPELAAAFGPTAIDPEPPESQMAALAAWQRAHLSPANLAGLVARYDAGIAFTDAALGELVRQLDADGQGRETIVLVTADHGEAFAEHGQLGHGYAPHDDQARVPLVLRLPERFPVRRGRHDSLVAHVDLLPTLAELAGLPSDPAWQGSSIVRELAARTASARTVYIQSDAGWAARHGDAKLIVDRESWSLFDLAADPAERTNLLLSGPESCRDACADLAAGLRELRTLARPRFSGGAGARPLDPDEVEELRALGYL